MINIKHLRRIKPIFIKKNTLFYLPPLKKKLHYSYIKQNDGGTKTTTVNLRMDTIGGEGNVSKVRVSILRNHARSNYNLQSFWRQIKDAVNNYSKRYGFIIFTFDGSYRAFEYVRNNEIIVK